MGCGLNKSSYREDLPRKGSRYNRTDTYIKLINKNY